MGEKNRCSAGTGESADSDVEPNSSALIGKGE